MATDSLVKRRAASSAPSWQQGGFSAAPLVVLPVLAWLAAGRPEWGALESPLYCTSSGSAPVTWPLASVVIFSTRASACRNSSSQRRFKASPRS